MGATETLWIDNGETWVNGSIMSYIDYR